MGEMPLIRTALLVALVPHPGSPLPAVRLPPIRVSSS
jgi:hypothetical protein